jgi:hypothetical protein
MSESVPLDAGYSQIVRRSCSLACRQEPRDLNGSERLSFRRMAPAS